MKIKQKPEDFQVREAYRFDHVPGGRYRVYLMDKQKLSTFEAVEQVRSRFGLRPGAISFCGLKDKQGRTEQLIAVEGADVSMQENHLRLKSLGRTDAPLSARNTTANRFSVTVRSLERSTVDSLPHSAEEISKLGVVNYFDSQRFGSLKHGQGFVAKELIRGDFEGALKRYMAVPSKLDASSDAKVKQFWAESWGKWYRDPKLPGSERYARILHHLRKKPDDFLGAFLQIDANYRALLLFTYQSYLWNLGVFRLLQLTLPKESLFPLPYQAGTLLFHTEAPSEVLHRLKKLTFPLLSPESAPDDEVVDEAVRWTLGKEKISLDQLKVPGAERKLYFKHEERPVLVFPKRLVLGRTYDDELNANKVKLNIAFTLPPGSYATLVVKRLFRDWPGAKRGPGNTLPEKPADPAPAGAPTTRRSSWTRQPRDDSPRTASGGPGGGGAGRSTGRSSGGSSGGTASKRADGQPGKRGAGGNGSPSRSNARSNGRKGRT